MKRAIIIVLDSVGIGELPDAAAFGDVGSNTLVNIKKVRPQTSLPNLCALGLGDIQGRDISLLGEVAAPKGCYGKMAERSIGKDTNRALGNGRHYHQKTLPDLYGNRLPQGGHGCL